MLCLRRLAIDWPDCASCTLHYLSGTKVSLSFLEIAGQLVTSKRSQRMSVVQLKERFTMLHRQYVDELLFLEVMLAPEYRDFASVAAEQMPAAEAALNQVEALLANYRAILIRAMPRGPSVKGLKISVARSRTRSSRAYGNLTRWFRPCLITSTRLRPTSPAQASRRT